MPILQPNQTLNFTAGPRGGTLTFTAPQNTSAQCPSLNGRQIFLTSVPKQVPLAAGSRYILTTGSFAVTYNLRQAAEEKI